MSPKLFGFGAHGGIVEDIPRSLQSAGFDPGQIDGIDGQGTTRAVTQVQQKSQLPLSGNVDDQLFGIDCGL